MERLLTAARAATGEALAEPAPEHLDAYTHLSKQEIARLVLCLLIEERLVERLAAFRSRPEQLPAQPVEG
jgi:hypothetical protein